MPRGRPRTFDIDHALDAALRVFWRHGYEGASLDDLTAAMGINRPSLYAAFGNKESLFRKALDRYARGPACHVQQALKQPTAQEVARSLMRGSIDLLANPGNPAGCLAVQAALATGKEADSVRKAAAAHRRSGEVALRQRFARAKVDGDLPRSARPADLARYLATVVHGMAVQAAGGATRSDLKKVAQMALRVWDDVTASEVNLPVRARK